MDGLLFHFVTPNVSLYFVLGRNLLVEYLGGVTVGRLKDDTSVTSSSGF